MSYGYVIRYSYVSALQILGSEVLLDKHVEERLERDRIARAKYIGPLELDPHDGKRIRRYVDDKLSAGYFIDHYAAIDYAQAAFNRAPSTEKGLIIEVISLEDNMLIWKNRK
jgi:hypothetical protein